MSSKSIYRFYVYAYLRSDGTPYYIGKGTGNRAYQQHADYSRRPRDKSRIIFLEKNLSNVGALALERRYIEWYGRKIDGSGILRNLTLGGDGHQGPMLTETKIKIAKTLTGFKRSESTREKMRIAANLRKSSYFWWFNPTTNETKRTKRDDISPGMDWIRGRPRKSR